MGTLLQLDITVGQDAIPRPDTAANEGKLNNVMVQERENNGVKDKLKKRRHSPKINKPKKKRNV